MQEKVITDLSVYSSKEAIKSFLPLFKKMKDLLSHHFNDGFLDYFSLMIEKYKFTKTLLHKQPKDFYDIYFPTKLKYNDEIVETNSASELFEKNKRITISGAAGSGKTTLIKHLFLYSLIESYKIPILITLRDLNKEVLSIDEYIKTKILNNKLAPNTDILKKLYKQGKFLFLFDGYDEINSDIKSKVIYDLETFIDKYPNNSYLITTRPYTNIDYFKDFHNYEMSELTDLDIEEFIKMQVMDEKISSKILDSINEKKESYIDSFLSNALLLTLYIITFNTNSQIPNKKYLFYRRVFDVLYKEHDSATKTGYERELKVKISQDELEEVLKYFAFISFFDNKFNFDKSYINEKLNIIKQKLNKEFDNNNLIEDLKLSLSLWLEDYGIYCFAHKSLQEYFAALYLTGQKEITQQKIYDKINDLESFLKNNDKKRDSDVYNFLNLCEEMSIKNYNEFHKIKVLRLLKNIISNESETFQWRMPFSIFSSSSSSHSTKYYSFFWYRLGKEINDVLSNSELHKMVYANENIYLCELFKDSSIEELKIYLNYDFQQLLFFKDMFLNPKRFLNKQELNDNNILLLKKYKILDIFEKKEEIVNNLIFEVENQIKMNNSIEEDILDII